MIKAVIFDMFETLITHFHFQSPLYFGHEIAEDAGVPEEVFLKEWRDSEVDRSLGKRSNESVIRDILLAEERYDQKLLDTIISKMRHTKEECFHHLHDGIIPMMDGLKDRNLKVGLITNCYSIEEEVIRSSILFPYFDAAVFSSAEGIRKPDSEIFRRCVSRLGVEPTECVYVGDGGSGELEEARHLGMKPMQAAWYLFSEVWQPVGRKEGFIQLEKPEDLLKQITDCNLSRIILK